MQILFLSLIVIVTVLKDSPMKKEAVSEQKKALEILHSVSPVKANQTMGFRSVPLGGQCMGGPLNWTATC